MGISNTFNHLHCTSSQVRERNAVQKTFQLSIQSDIQFQSNNTMWDDFDGFIFRIKIYSFGLIAFWPVL